MKFKHAFHVFVDNFNVTYKQLLYRLIIFVVAAGIGWGALTPFIKDFIDSEALNSILTNFQNLVLALLNGKLEALSSASESIVSAYSKMLELINTKISELALVGLLLLSLLIITKWFMGLGNYTTAVLINDKMALRTESSFVRTLISHFKEAALYNLIYVPLAVLFDLIIATGLLLVLFYMIDGIKYFFITVFIFVLMMVLAIAVKMTLTCDWLPALVRGKMGQRRSIKYAFSRKKKQTFNIFSNFIVLIVVILGLNIATTIFTFGVGMLLTLPASFVLLISFEMVNYYDREELRYFLDKNTIIKPDKEKVLTREQFFKGIDPDDEQ